MTTYTPPTTKEMADYEKRAAKAEEIVRRVEMVTKYNFSNSDEQRRLVTFGVLLALDPQYNPDNVGFNDGIEAAAKECERLNEKRGWTNGWSFAEAIRALKKE